MRTMRIPTELLHMALYLLARLEEPTPLTKLTKLLFLLDYLYHKIKGKTYTGAVWIRYFYGPWSFALYEAKDILEDCEFIIEILQTKKDRTIRLISITGEGLKYISEERLHEIIQRDRVLEMVIRSLVDFVQRKSVEDIMSLVYNIPEVRYTMPGRRIKFLKHPIIILQEISRKLEEILNIRPKALSFEELNKLLDELKERITSGRLEEHPYWEYYLSLGSLLDIAKEVYDSLMQIQRELNLDISPTEIKTL